MAYTAIHRTPIHSKRFHRLRTQYDDESESPGMSPGLPQSTATGDNNAAPGPLYTIVAHAGDSCTPHSPDSVNSSDSGVPSSRRSSDGPAVSRMR